MKKLSLFLFIMLSIGISSQEKLSLTDCYNLVQKNYPLAKKTDLLAQQNELDIEVIKKGKLPNLDLLVQATYQSDVTKTPFMTPETGIEAPNLDQYKTNISVNQLIYAGGKINAASEVKMAELKTQQKQIEVSLYQLKNQVNQLYFSILHLQEKRALIIAKKNQLSSQLKEVKAGIEFGTILPTSDTVLEVELLNIEQQLIEIDLNKINLIETLSTLIGNNIETSTTFE